MIKIVLDAMGSRWFRAAVKDLPGYVFPGTAEPQSVAAALREAAAYDPAGVQSTRSARK